MNDTTDTNVREELLKLALKILVPNENSVRIREAQAKITSHFDGFDKNIKNIDDCLQTKQKLKNIKAQTERLQISIQVFAKHRPLVNEAMMRKLSELSEQEHPAEKGKKEHQRLSYENLTWLLNGGCVEQLERIIAVTAGLQVNMPKNSLRKQRAEEFIRRTLGIYHQYHPSKASSSQNSEFLTFAEYLWEYYFRESPTDTLRTDYIQPAIKQWKEAGIINRASPKKRKTASKTR